MTIGSPALVHITRDAEVDADDSDDSRIDEVRRQVRQRRFEPVVRLEFTEGLDPRIRVLMTSHFGLSPDDVYQAPDALNCSTLFELSGLDLPDLKDPTWHPVKPPALEKCPDLFAAIRAGDVLPTGCKPSVFGIRTAQRAAELRRRRALRSGTGEHCSAPVCSKLK